MLGLARQIAHFEPGPFRRTNHIAAAVVESILEAGVLHYHFAR